LKLNRPNPLGDASTGQGAIDSGRGWHHADSFLSHTSAQHSGSTANTAGSVRQNQPLGEFLYIYPASRPGCHSPTIEPGCHNVKPRGRGKPRQIQ
ncbi:hypothetical protein BaRGS_00029329, partial [Batillaria attramentaria]